MSTNRGIFDSLPNQQQDRPDSPFSVAPEAGGEQAKASPFKEAGSKDSPFTVVDETAGPKAQAFDSPTKLPERRKADSPFQMADPAEGFGFEAPAKTAAASPFESAPAKTPSASPFESAPASSPFSAAAEKAPASPFSVDPKTAASPSTQAAIAAFTEWQDPAPQAAFAAAAESAPAQVPSAFAAAPAAEAPAAAPAPQQAASQPAAQPAAPAPAPAPQQAAAAPAPQQAAPVQQQAAPAPQQVAPAPEPQSQESQSDSFNIRQLELRAIFGVDRDLNADEILQRSRALPGMRNIARLSSTDIAAVEAIKNLLPSIGFGSGTLKLYSGSVPLEFIREGSTVLAVQTDGGFAPGVRETLMIVARELGKLD